MSYHDTVVVATNIPLLACPRRGGRKGVPAGRYTRARHAVGDADASRIQSRRSGPSMQVFEG